MLAILCAPAKSHTLSLHDALPISSAPGSPRGSPASRGAATTSSAGLRAEAPFEGRADGGGEDRKSTRLNSSHLVISYAVFCLKKEILYCHKKNLVNACIASASNQH